MEGLFFGDQNNPVEKVKQNTASLSLLACGTDMDIMIQEIKAGNMFSIDPDSENDIMEFFYILEGEIEYKEKGKKKLLNDNQYFYIDKLTETANFKTVSDTKLLYISSPPVFHYLSSDIKELYNIVKKVEEKDFYTHNHGKRVENFSLKIGEALKISRKNLRRLGYASLFHDIGKVEIPDHILKKKGSLTSQEFEIIKNHPLRGKKMVKDTFLEEIGDIIEQHHENIDGSGYPQGLKGEDILIEAKIIRVVDTFDAITSDRPYKKGASQKEALAEIKRLRSVFFDERVVDAFIALF